jgi:hypothetical protein
MHPHAPALVQHGSPSGKQAFLHDERLHDPPPDELLGGGDVEPPPLPLAMVFATQFPKLQIAFVALQLVQALPPCPHALSSIPLLQAPLSQQPVGHVVVLQGKEASSPTAGPPVLPSSPPGAGLPGIPPPLLEPPPLPLKVAPPPPSAARTTLSGSPPAPPPVAQATTMNPPPSKSAPCATQRLPQIILRLLPTLARAARASLISRKSRPYASFP